MITITLNEKQIAWCKELGFRRSASKNHADTKNSRNLSKDKPAWHRHFVGVCGEFAYAQHTGQKVDTNIYHGYGDNGVDFANGVDVKTSAFIPNSYQNMPDLLLFEKQFARKKADIYVLAWLRLPDVILMGSITQEKLLEVKEIKQIQKHDRSYVINNKHLTPII